MCFRGYYIRGYKSMITMYAQPTFGIIKIIKMNHNMLSSLVSFPRETLSGLFFTSAKDFDKGRARASLG